MLARKSANEDNFINALNAAIARTNEPGTQITR